MVGCAWEPPAGAPLSWSAPTPMPQQPRTHAPCGASPPPQTVRSPCLTPCLVRTHPGGSGSVETHRHSTDPVHPTPALHCPLVEHPAIPWACNRAGTALWLNCLSRQPRQRRIHGWTVPGPAGTEEPTVGQIKTLHRPDLAADILPTPALGGVMAAPGPSCHRGLFLPAPRNPP